LIEFGNLEAETSKGKVRRSTLIVTHDESIANRAKRRVRLKDGKVL